MRSKHGRLGRSCVPITFDVNIKRYSPISIMSQHSLVKMGAYCKTAFRFDEMDE